MTSVVYCRSSAAVVVVVFVVVDDVVRIVVEELSVIDYKEVCHGYSENAIFLIFSYLGTQISK